MMEVLMPGLPLLEDFMAHGIIFIINQGKTLP